MFRGSLACFLVSAALLGSSAMGQATASRPAAAALKADLFLKNFPASAAGLASRPDARNLQLEGRVREVRTVALAGGKSELRIILVGRGQADESPAHFTCHLEKKDDLPTVSPDDIITLTGSAGAVVQNADRIDLNNCHDLKVLGAPTVGERIAGLWQGRVTLDGAAIRKENTARGKNNDGTPPSDFVSPTMRLDVLFKNDGTYTADLTDGTQVVRHNAGKWLVTRDDDVGTTVRLDAPGSPFVDTAASLSGGTLTLNIPGFADKHVQPDFSLTRQQGQAQSPDAKAMRDQLVKWIGANCTLAPQQSQELLQHVQSEFDAAMANRNGYLATIGSGLVRRARTTVVVSALGKLSVLEYSDAQTQRVMATKTNLDYAQLPTWGKLMAPEVKIDSFTFDNKGPLDPAVPLTGKITLRALRRTVPGTYVLVMCTPDRVSLCPINAPGADADTASFSIPPLAGALPKTLVPIPALIFLGRQDDGNITAPSPSACIISDQAATLLEIAPPR